MTKSRLDYGLTTALDHMGTAMKDNPMKNKTRHFECTHHTKPHAVKRLSGQAAAVLGLLTSVLFIAVTTSAWGQEVGGQESAEEVVKGPHRGRVLREGEFAIEVTIFETGIPPEFRIYVTDNGQNVPPNEVRLEATLTRLGGRVDAITFTPENDYLVSGQEVVEPHSFDVTFTARHRGVSHTWQYSSYEGRTTLTERAITAAEIETAVAGPQTISDELVLTGTIGPSEHRVAHIAPRFAGVVREGRVRTGDWVERGEVVAIIESNQSLQPYEVRSPIAGVIISGRLVPGEFVSENQTAYVLADTAEVWADFRVYGAAADKVKPGQKVLVKSGTADPLPASVWYVTTYADERTQSRFVRVVVPNSEGKLFPGMFATAAIEVDQKEVPVAVKTSAIQTYRDWTAVFIRDGNTFEVQPLEVGEANEEWTEVTAGLRAGMTYVAENSFLIKADTLKSGASHDH